MSEFVKAEEISRNRVRYTDSSGKTFIHSKGTWAWRNNNPGNIRKPRKENMPPLKIRTMSKIENIIYVIRDQKVMLDSDLAELYEVETAQLTRPASP